MVGYEDGSAWAADEYGRTPRHRDYQDERQRDREWKTFQKAKLAWAVKREGCSLARDHDDFAKVHESIMRNDLAVYHAQHAARDFKRSGRGSKVRGSGRAGGAAA
jgi:hypothetical protein